MEPTTYRRKPVTVYGVQMPFDLPAPGPVLDVSGDIEHGLTKVAVREWLEENGATVTVLENGHLGIESVGVVQEIHPGDTVLKEGAWFTVWNPADLADQYEEYDPDARIVMVPQDHLAIIVNPNETVGNLLDDLFMQKLEAHQQDASN